MPAEASDAQWALIAPLLAPPSQRGRDRSYGVALVVKALFEGGQAPALAMGKAHLVRGCWASSSCPVRLEMRSRGQSTKERSQWDSSWSYFPLLT